MSANFRKAFKILSKDAIHWFPGHMGKGMRQMQQKLKMVDCVIEVHDSRIPFSGRNTDFKHTVTGVRPHILVLNKKDISDQSTFKAIAEKIQKTEGIDNVIFTNCKDHQCEGVKQVIPLAKQLIMNSNRYNRTENQDYNLMIVGVPNVGKSSLTNALRNRHLKTKGASAVGSIAGITRSVLTRIKISERPLIYMFDTPGILTPRINDGEQGMKLALVSCLQDHLVGETMIADYLLYWLNKNEEFGYVEKIGVNEPTDEIAQVLITIAKTENLFQRIKNFDGGIIVRPNLEAASTRFIRLFRSGDLGSFNLDKDFL